MFLISRVTTTLHCTVVVHYDIMWNNRKTSDHIKFCTNIWTNQNRRVIWTCRLTWTFLYIFWRLIFDTPSRAWHKRGKKFLKTYTSFNRIIEDIVFPTPPQNIIPSWWKVWTIRHFSNSNLDREGPTWKKLYKIHNDPPFKKIFWIPKNYLGEKAFERRSLTWTVNEQWAFKIWGTWCPCYTPKSKLPDLTVRLENFMTIPPKAGFQIRIHSLRIRIQGFENECGSRYGSGSKAWFLRVKK